MIYRSIKNLDVLNNPKSKKKIEYEYRYKNNHL